MLPALRCRRDPACPSSEKKRAVGGLLQDPASDTSYLPDLQSRESSASQPTGNDECKQDDSSTESSDSLSSAALVNNMELDQIGTLGMENLKIKIKKEPEDWVHIEDETTWWEEI